MVIGAVSHLVVFPVQHKYIRRAWSLCVHKFLQIIDLQIYRPAFHSWKYLPGHVRIAINEDLTRTHSILFFNKLNFANERLRILSLEDPVPCFGLNKRYCATSDQKLQGLKLFILTLYGIRLAADPNIMGT